MAGVTRRDAGAQARAASESNRATDGGAADEKPGCPLRRKRPAPAARHGIPLAAVIARYFFYALVGIALAWVAAFSGLSAGINTGAVYAANWGPANADAVAETLAAQGAFNAEDVPSAYRYLVLEADGSTRATDMDEARAEQAREVADAELFGGSADAQPGEAQMVGRGGTTYIAFTLADGSRCILTCRYLPEFANRTLRDTLPNPQDVMLVGGALASVAVIAAVTHRAGRVIRRKISPLLSVAELVGREELDFAVDTSNVREVNEVLAAMERMRGSLKDSLEARWRAERAQRDQVAALAHDLKTPLTVIRANADYVSEELAEAPEDENLTAAARGELADAARDIAAGTERLDGYVRLLIEASRGGHVGAKASVAPGELCTRIADEATALVRARGLAFTDDVDPAVAEAADALLDRDAVTRAAMNLVANAADHARSAVRLSCTIGEGAMVVEVADDGPGFSPAALEHGRERFFTDDAARTSAGAGEPHYGIGLAVSAEVAENCGGTLELANRHGADGAVAGAVATLVIPLEAGER